MIPRQRNGLAKEKETLFLFEIGEIGKLWEDELMSNESNLKHERNARTSSLDDKLKVNSYIISIL